VVPVEWVSGLDAGVKGKEVPLKPLSAIATLRGVVFRKGEMRGGLAMWLMSIDGPPFVQDYRGRN
jgi:hypothetical protein